MVESKEEECARSFRRNRRRHRNLKREKNWWVSSGSLEYPSFVFQGNWKADTRPAKKFLNPARLAEEGAVNRDPPCKFHVKDHWC